MPVQPQLVQPILMVPIHLDALLLPTERSVVAATANFAGLPYFNGEQDVNGSTAYLSETILARPFQNRNLYLPAGIHLHWSLPDALTRARRISVAANADEDPDDLDVQIPPAEFPCVPNRWLVVRSRAGQPEKTWVVESDYLHPEGAGAESGSATYPIKQERGSTHAPFRYLGRVLTFEEWQAHGGDGEYLDTLTTIGYGEPTFAALYANCRNVFGLHDDEISNPQEGLRYDIIGWYSHVAQDYVRQLATKLPVGGGVLPADKLLAALAEQARWAPQVILQKQQLTGIGDTDELWDELVERRWLASLEADPTQAMLMANSWRAGRPLDDHTIQGQVETILNEMERTALNKLAEAGQLLCYARLTFAAPAPVGEEALQIAIGNTGPQALSAYLANKLTNEQPTLASHAVGQPTLEDRLEAIMLAPRLRDQRLDLDAKFREARHETGFTALQAGHVWTLRQQPREPGPANAPQTSQQQQITDLLSPTELNLLDAISHGINALNAAQQKYDRATYVIESLRHQLFADWYRYMLCLYPVEGAAENYPAINKVGHYIEQAMLPTLQRRISQTGRLVHQHEQDRWAAPYPVAVNSDPNSLASLVAQEADQLRGKLDQFNAIDAVVRANLVYKLGRTHAPRYWQPNNPVILLAGEQLQPTMRHGQDGRARPDGMLGCRVVSDQAFGDASLTTQMVSALIDRLAVGATNEEIGFFTWSESPWHPLLLEWEVEVLPIAGRSNLDPQGGLYNSDFIIANYAPAENEPDLVVKGGKGVLSPAANLYSGSSILTPYAQTFHTQRLASYILSIYCKANGLPVPPDEEAETYLAAQREQVVAWHTGQHHDTGDNEDSIAIALAAFDQLQKVKVLSQSLGGFNEALLTRKQTLQLNVDDPLAFADFLPFIEAVRAGVARSNSSAPQPLNDFNPIRSGALKVWRLRLVDTFGQVRDIDTSNLLAIQQMRATAGFVALPPRFVQPARLNFRWLSADLGDGQMSAQASETPICGWVVANHLANSLLIYNGSGQAIGAINSAGGWEPAPGAPLMPADQIPDDHLKKMVTYLLGRSPDFIGAFHAALDSALEQIDPANYAQHPELALLMGRPVALVRAELSLELQGLPAVHEGWNQLRQDLERTTRDSDGFTGVQIPIRIGDYSQLNDGLVGYWIEQGDTFGDTFFAPQSTPSNNPSIQTHANGELALLQSLDAPPQTLSMLVDPRGTLHATCGILPVKVIDIPPEQYSAALRRIEVTFGAGPLLTGPRQLSVPLPTEPGYAWTWLEAVNSGWRETWTFPTIARAIFEEGLALQIWAQLHAGAGAWLRPAPDTPAMSVLVPAEQRTALRPEFAPLASAIAQVLEQFATGDASLTRAAFVATAGEAIGGPIWTMLLESTVGWLTALVGEPLLAQVTIKRAGAVQELPAPYTGTEALVERVIDHYQAGLVPPSSVARFGVRQEVREGWLKLHQAEHIG